MTTRDVIKSSYEATDTSSSSLAVVETSYSVMEMYNVYDRSYDTNKSYEEVVETSF